MKSLKVKRQFPIRLALSCARQSLTAKLTHAHCGLGVTRQTATLTKNQSDDEVTVLDVPSCCFELSSAVIMNTKLQTLGALALQNVRVI